MSFYFPKLVIDDQITHSTFSSHLTTLQKYKNIVSSKDKRLIEETFYPAKVGNKNKHQRFLCRMREVFYILPQISEDFCSQANQKSIIDFSKKNEILRF